MTRRLIYIALFVTASVPVACDNTIDPFEESDSRAFAVFGYLDMGADTQLVRIAPIRGEDASAPRPATADVVTTNLDTGTRMTWKDSLVVLDDGSEGHLFYAVFHPTPGADYSLEIRTGGTVALRAFTSIPPVPSFETETPSVAGDDVSQRVAWNGIRMLTELRVTYRLRVGGDGKAMEVPVEYDPRFYAAAGDRLSVLVPFDRDFLLVRQHLRDRFGDVQFSLEGMKMTIRALSAEWEDRSTAGNIENGEGFFASVGEFSGEWTIEDSLAQHIGYAESP